MSASPARHSAREVLTRVRERAAFAHEVMDSALKREPLSPPDAAFATQLAYGALQTQGTLDEALGRYLAGKRLEPRVRDALRVSAYEILFLHTESRAAVHQGVELVREVRPQAAGLANAVLRRLADDAPSFPWGDPRTDLGALARRYGHPLWLAELWSRELGREVAESIMAADNEPAPLYLAPNPFSADAEHARAMLRTDGAEPLPCALPGCIEAGVPSAAVRGAALRSGVVFAADAAAQLVARLVRALPGHKIVEVGAGRGTKTALVQASAIRAGGPADVIAVDLHAFKAELLKERLSRWGVPCVTTLVGDASDFSAIEGAPAYGSVDAVLVDAPCSGLGTLRRHPDKRWRVSPRDMADLAELGAKLLCEAARLVRPEGFVVYSTCTIADCENVDVVRAFLSSEEGSRFRIDPIRDEVPEQWRRFVSDEGFFSSVVERGGPDGHFAARLVRD